MAAQVVLAAAGVGRAEDVDGAVGAHVPTGVRADALAARGAGVNFFDNAEAYAGGESERLMGRAFAELGWPRESYLVSTKFYWGLSRTVNARNTLNRKYLMQAIDGSLERFGLDRPLHEQYFVFLGNAFEGDMGQSFVFGQPALELILQRIGVEG